MTAPDRGALTSIPPLRRKGRPKALSGASLSWYESRHGKTTAEASVRPDQSFKGRQFTAEVILWAVRWYLMFPVSYRDLELMLGDRGVDVSYTTLFRWTQTYA
jgi:hypothetical protein